MLFGYAPFSIPSQNLICERQITKNTSRFRQSVLQKVQKNRNEKLREIK